MRRARMCYTQTWYQSLVLGDNLMFGTNVVRSRSDCAALPGSGLDSTGSERLQQTISPSKFCFCIWRPVACRVAPAGAQAGGG